MSLLTTFNSLLAISAGLVSDLMVRQLDLPVLAPFLAAIPCLGLSCLLMSWLWSENYGSQAPVLTNYRQGGMSSSLILECLALLTLLTIVRAEDYLEQRGDFQQPGLQEGVEEGSQL